MTWRHTRAKTGRFLRTVPHLSVRLLDSRDQEPMDKTAACNMHTKVVITDPVIQIATKLYGYTVRTGFLSINDTVLS